MLIIFYFTLLTLLSCVRSVKVFTQKPSVLTEQKGKSVTMDCNVEKDENRSPDQYGDGFTSSRFTSRAQSKIDYSLIISNVDVGDSAVYYCGTYDGSAREQVSVE
ncbi:unnamed protein product [Leuciscus chuanchicus]